MSDQTDQYAPAYSKAVSSLATIAAEKASSYPQKVRDSFVPVMARFIEMSTSTQAADGHFQLKDPSHHKRLVKSPKVYDRDPGLTHSLLGIETMEDMLGHPVVGGSWEGFCVEALIAAAPRGTEAIFYRSSAGAEIDLILKLPRGGTWAIEIKRTTQPKVTSGFHIAAKELDASERILVYAEPREVPGKWGVRAMPLLTALARLTHTKL